MAGYNKSPYAFDDLREVFQRAMDSPRGIKIICKSRSEAVITRSRMNYLRKMDRKENAITYPSDHPMHMRSAWDRLVLRIPNKEAPNCNTLFIEKRSIEKLTIEEISKGESPDIPDLLEELGDDLADPDTAKNRMVS